MFTSDSKKPLQILLCLVCVLLITLAVNNIFLQQYRQNNLDSYLAAVFDKQRLLSSKPSPKIILVGGSNVAFGFDSTLISEGTGLPVVNAGLQGGLGLRFTIKSIEPYINPGDIVIISPEYHNLFSRLVGGEVLSQMLVVNPDGWGNLSSFNEVWELFKAFPAMHTNAIRDMIELLIDPKHEIFKSDMSIYSRAAFDTKTGDITTNPASNKPEKDLSLELNYKVPNIWLVQAIHALNKFNEFTISNGATLFFVYPNTITVTDAYTKDLLNRLDKVLRAQLKFPILDTPAEAEFPYELIFDTAYHLNDLGRDIRSQEVLERLCTVEPGINCQ